MQIAVLAGATVVPAWALALVTRTLPRFLGAAAGLLVGGIIAVGPRSSYWTSTCGRPAPAAISRAPA